MEIMLQQIAESALDVVRSGISEIEILRINRDKQHILFGGTRVFGARDTTSGFGIGVSLCVALRTGFSTAMDQLVRLIIFLISQTRFNFQEISFKFIASFGSNFDPIILRALDLITIAVPPKLLARMNSGISYVLSRLKGRKRY
ncbi:MAG: hypothetical protein EZS28_021353 [Streblomastix strix]|uniref:Uncharacterized protein n=1 Tax=Streblomastix strix TaxID=222440 RepID=A0A5J4VKL5_9EUKA|nr:MAG: hypothetical protein EZS28_021353 [Streblomastix strix]